MESNSSICQHQTIKPKFDLTLTLAPDGQGGLSGGFEYDADLFDASSVAAWSQAFSRVLEQFIATPEAALCTRFSAGCADTPGPAGGLAWHTL